VWIAFAVGEIVIAVFASVWGWLRLVSPASPGSKIEKEPAVSYRNKKSNGNGQSKGKSLGYVPKIRN
jgi:hypothetical protein